MSRYLSTAEVVEINAEMVGKFGGTHAIRDNALLESAVARPRSGYYEDIFEQAAALFESLSQNHPFVDGNKRTAITATGVFLCLTATNYCLTTSKRTAGSSISIRRTE